MSGRGRIAQQLAILRDEVLLTSEHGEAAPGAAYFDAIVAAVEQREAPGHGGVPSDDVDRVLAAALDAQLALRGPDGAVLAEADATFDRLVVAVDRSLENPADLMVVVDCACTVFAQLASHVSRAAITRAARDRAERVRQELVVRQLEDALAEQGTNLARLRADLASNELL